MDSSYIFVILTNNTARELQSPLQALTANFLCGKALIFPSSLEVLRLFSWGVRAFLMARVFLGRRSKGLYFLLLYNFLRFSFCFWCITMYTRAIDLRTTRMLNLEAAPPVTLATLRLPSSVFKSSSCLVSSSFFLLRSSEHLTRGILSQACKTEKKPH